MIFSAGLGTRFKPWTDQHPKALAPVNGKPLLQRNIEYLQQYHIKDVVVNIHHFPDQMKAAIQQNNGWGSRVEISDETEELLDTGGGMLKARHLLDNGQLFFTLNADILTDLNLNHLLEFHKSKMPLISLAVTKRRTSRYFLFDENDRLCGWRNTTTGEEKIVIQNKNLTEKAYSCVALFEPRVFELIPFSGKFSLVDLYLELAREHLILGYDHTGDLLVDVGKPGSIEKAEQIFP